MLIDRKNSLEDMDAEQRAHWLAAGLVTSPDTYCGRVESFALDSEERCLQLAMFFRNGMVNYLNESGVGFADSSFGEMVREGIGSFKWAVYSAGGSI